MSKNKYTKEQIEEAVKNSMSIADVCRFFGIKARGSNYETIKSYMSFYDVDDSHFTGQRWNRDIKYLNKTALHSLEEIMKENTNFGSDLLKKRLIAEGLKEHKCEVCGTTEWQGKPVPIELHHINGNHYDNRFENLQILCRNCHAQTDSYCRKKSVRKNVQEAERLSAHTHVYTCEYCGKTFKTHKKQSYCSRDCYNKAMRQTNELKAFTKENFETALLQYKTISDLAIHFNTSRTTIRKYLVKYELKDFLDVSAQLHSKAVIQMDMQGNQIKEWPSMSDAERTLGIHDIERCCKGKRVSCGGYKWKYKI